MQTKIVKIGNSQGIIISKKVLEQCGFSHSVEMEVKDSSLILTAVKAKDGWEEYFQAMATNQDNELLIDDTISNEYDREWEW